MPLNGHKLNGSSRVMLAALKAAIRQGVLVMLALPDGHDPRRFQLRSIWMPVPDDVGLAYAYNEIKTPRLVPTPRDITRAEIVDSWLVAGARLSIPLSLTRFNERKYTQETADITAMVRYLLLDARHSEQRV